MNELCFTSSLASTLGFCWSTSYQPLSQFLRLALLPLTLHSHPPYLSHSYTHKVSFYIIPSHRSLYFSSSALTSRTPGLLPFLLRISVFILYLSVFSFFNFFLVQCGRLIIQSINLLKAKGPNGHLHRRKIHGLQ